MWFLNPPIYPTQLKKISTVQNFLHFSLLTLLTYFWFTLFHSFSLSSLMQASSFKVLPWSDHQRSSFCCIYAVAEPCLICTHRHDVDPLQSRKSHWYINHPNSTSTSISTLIASRQNIQIISTSCLCSWFYSNLMVLFSSSSLLASANFSSWL